MYKADEGLRLELRLYDQKQTVGVLRREVVDLRRDTSAIQEEARSRIALYLDEQLARSTPHPVDG
jgi:hypothetical protein